MAELVFTAMPVEGTITGRFGQAEGYAAPHRGVDIACPAGTAVRWTGTEPGRAVEFQNDGGFGIGVCIDAPGTPWYCLTAHMSRADVRPGDTVQPGQVLGLSGFSGAVVPAGPAGAHVHWQVCRSTTFPLDIAQSTDPLAMVREVEAPAAAEGGDATLEERLEAVLVALTGLGDQAAQLERLRRWNFFPAGDARSPGVARGNSLLDAMEAVSARAGGG